MQCSLRLERPRCSFRAGATSEGWKGSCQGGSLPGRAVRRGAQSCRDASNHSYPGVVPKGLDASLPAGEDGSHSIPLGGAQYSSQPKLHNGQVFQSICSTKKLLGNGGGWAVVQGLCQLPFLYMSRSVTGAKQSRLSGTLQGQSPHPQGPSYSI